MPYPSDPSPDAVEATSTEPAGDEKPETSAPEAASETPQEPTTADQVSEIVAGIQAEGDAIKRLATALGPFARSDSYSNLATLGKTIDRVAEKLRGATQAPAHALEAAEKALELVRQDLDSRRKAMREQLAPQLRAACEARGLGLRVLRREEPVELRIPPLGVVIDREKGSAELRFGRMTLAQTPADAVAIVEAHSEAVAGLNRGSFDPSAFFQACHRAWNAARAAGGGGERVEILDFLPYLALQMQPPAFQVDPSVRNFKGYSRVQFAWDVLRLRREGTFVQDGWRFNLGVATGTTAQQKKRVIWFEDEHGDGEFKLTVFFTRMENAG